MANNKPFHDVDGEYILEAVYYHPPLKCLMWKERPRHHFKTDGAFKLVNAACAHTRVSGTNNGWPCAMINGKRIRCHNIMWLIKTGELPQYGKQCYPINGDKMDYSPDNLYLKDKRNNAGIKYKAYKRKAHIRTLPTGRKIYVPACECGGL